MSPLSKIFPSAVAVFALLILAACSSVSDKEQKATQKQSPTAVVEKVNGVPITQAALGQAVKALLAQSGAPQQVPPEAMKNATEAALNQLTAAELLYQAGSKLEVKDLDKQVATKIGQAKYQYPSQADFENALKAVGMTQKEMEEAARKDIVINNFIEKQFNSEAPVTEEEVKKFYADNKGKAFTQGERIKASHIIVAIPEKATPEAKKQAKEKAAGILKRVKAGEDFAALAKAESDSPTKAQGGDLGIIGRGQTLPAFEKAAFALKPGEVSDVVEMPNAYDIIKVTQKLPPSTEKYENVKAKIVVFLKRDKVRKAVAAYVEQLRAKAKIEKM